MVSVEGERHMPHKPKREFKDTRTPDNVTPGSIWSMSAENDIRGLAAWLIEGEFAAAAIAEILGTGAAITFGALRSGTGMSVRILHEGRVVHQRFFDDAFDLNQELQALAARGREDREARELRERREAAPPPPQVD